MRIKKDKSTKVGIIGKIKVGIRNERGNPISIDYFRFTGRYAKKAHEMFGDKPKVLQVVFASDDSNDNCVQRYELRNKGGQLVCYTDGESLWMSEVNGFRKWSEEELNVKGGLKTYMRTLQTEYTAGKYKARFYECLYLRVMLLGFPIIGQFEIFTKASKSSIENIINTYDMVLEQAGRIKFIPFNISVQKVQSNRLIPNENYKRSYSVINLEANLSIESQERVLQLGDNIKGLVTPEKLQGLSSGIVNDNQEQEEIITEAEIVE